MRVPGLTLAVSSMLVAAGLGTASAQKVAPAKPIPPPTIPSPALPSPTLTPTVPILPAPAPLPNLSPASPTVPAAIPIDPCKLANPPGYCIYKTPLDGGGDDGSPQNSDLCQADPKPPWCGRSIAPTASPGG